METRIHSRSESAATTAVGLTLSNGRKLPLVGLGTLIPQKGEDEVIDAVKAAVKAGYRHIDCAAIYRNERAIGHALKELFIMDIVKREDLFITSKLWNTCHKPDLVLPSLNKTLEDLGLEYLDLYLMHWPMAYKEGGEMNPVDENGKTLYSNVHYVETWHAMEDCQDMGLTKSIGLSNFNSKQIDEICNDARIKPVILQVEVHVHNTNTNLIQFAKKKDISITAFAPLGSPMRKVSHTPLLEEPVVKEIASSHSKTPAQVALRFLTQQEIAVVPKSVDPKRQEENLHTLDFDLTKEEIEKLSALNKNFRQFSEQIALEHVHYPFNESF